MRRASDCRGSHEFARGRRWCGAPGGTRSRTTCGGHPECSDQSRVGRADLRTKGLRRAQDFIGKRPPAPTVEVCVRYYVGKERAVSNGQFDRTTDP